MESSLTNSGFDDAVVADGIEILVKEMPLLSKESQEKIEALTSDAAKASEMTHAIRHEIHVRLEENPARLKTGIHE